jgi:hypothetical protein
MLFDIMEKYPSHFPIHYTIFRSLQTHHLPRFILIPCSVIVNNISKEIIKGEGSEWCLIWKWKYCFDMEVASMLLEQYPLVVPIHATTFHSLPTLHLPKTLSFPVQ